MSLQPLLLLLILLTLSPATSTSHHHHHPHPHHRHHLHRRNTFTPTTTLHSLCNSTPHPTTCLSTLSLSLPFPTTLTSALSSLLSTALFHLSPLLLPSHPPNSPLQDCADLHRISLSSLRKATTLLSSPSLLNLHLSAALTNKNTCLDSLRSSTDPSTPSLLSSLTSAYAHVSNALSLVSHLPPRTRRRTRQSHPSPFPSWLSRRARRILDTGDDGGDGLTLTVAADGSGNFTTIGEAVAFAPSNSEQRTFIWITAGVYEENVDIGADKVNIVMLGEGRGTTVIRGRRSASGGWTSFRSATVGVSGQGFLARDIAFENVAGADQGQAVALRVNADVSAFYRCTISGFQDTLYVHSFRQFYRECDILGTVDFIFGNAVAVLQACDIRPRLPAPGQSNVITAQNRDDPNEDTGISIDRCSITAADDLAASPGSVRTYLGRPWQPYSRTVIMESFIDDLVDPSGWLNWDGDQGLDTLYYGEYENDGPGSDTSNRVDWPGFHVMSYDEAVGFSVSEFIDGDEWIGDTSFPYDDGV